MNVRSELSNEYELHVVFPLGSYLALHFFVQCLNPWMWRTVAQSVPENTARQTPPKSALPSQSIKSIPLPPFKKLIFCLVSFTL